MKENLEQKCHVCRFCKQSFSNGKKLGGHMRRHLALISACRKMGTRESSNGEKGLRVSREDDEQILKKDAIKQGYDANCRKQSMQENEQGIINGEMGLDFDDGDDVMIKNSQHMTDVDQDYRANAYVLRENPKRSWRVSNSSKDFGSFCKKRCQSRRESMKNSVCDKCGKSFNSMKALYGHMRCHSIKRSQLFDGSSVMSSSEVYHDDDGDDEVANPVRKKRSCTRYKSPKPNHQCTTLSSSDEYDEVENGAICLMMLSRGVRSLDEVKLVISSQTLHSNVVFEVSVNGSMEYCELNSKSNLCLKKDSIVESGSGQLNPGQALSTPVKYKSPKKPRPSDQDFGDMDATDSDISLELKRRSMDPNCPICLKEYGSGRALDCHKRFHTDIDAKVVDNNHISDVHGLINPDLDFIRKESRMVTWGSS